MKRFLPKSYLLYIAIFLVLVFIVLLILLFNAPGTIQREATPISTPTPISIRPQATAPAIADLPKKGVTIDTQAPIVQESQQEVAKVRKNLPFITKFRASTGQEVSIVIPAVQYQDDPWKLTVNVFGPEYTTPLTHSDYEKEKQTFLEGANTVFEWIRDSDADPNAVIIKWGDKAYIQEKAEAWLKNP